MCKCLTQFNRPRPVAWFFFILAFGACMAAGSWQVNRLAWKQGLIAAIAEANEKAPLTTLPKDTAALDALQFRKVKLGGAWRGDMEFHLTPRYFRDQFGYWIITPFILPDGRTLLVNRGWVPAAKKLPVTRAGTSVHGKATITGMVRLGSERSYFTPISQPEKNIWFGRDVADMAAFAQLEHIVPVMVDIINVPIAGTIKTQAEVTSLPIPSDGIIRLRNDHLSYIITWYGIASGILLIFVLYHRRKQ